MSQQLPDILKPYAELLDEIASVAGEKAALKVAEARGGTKAYFTERPRAGNWLVEAVGHDIVVKIGAYFASGQGGIELEVPLGPTAGRRAAAAPSR